MDPATLRRRVTRDLPRLGRLPREDDVEDDDATLDPDLLAQIYAASVQGYGALFPKSLPPMVHLGRSRAARTLKGSLCCNDEGFSLHAHGCVPAGLRERLQHLCRYVARLAIASERLPFSPDGCVITFSVHDAHAI